MVSCRLRTKSIGGYVYYVNINILCWLLMAASVCVRVGFIFGGGVRVKVSPTRSQRKIIILCNIIIISLYFFAFFPSCLRGRPATMLVGNRDKIEHLGMFPCLWLMRVRIVVLLHPSHRMTNRQDKTRQLNWTERRRRCCRGHTALHVGGCQESGLATTTSRRFILIHVHNNIIFMCVYVCTWKEIVRYTHTYTQ